MSGIVIPGRGLGAPRMANPKVLDRLREMFGFPLVPGTLNVRLPQREARTFRTRFVSAAELSPSWEAQTGQSGYFISNVLIADRYRGVAFHAKEPGYPSDLVELLCEVNLRSALRLRDDDQIRFSVGDP